MDSDLSASESSSNQNLDFIYTPKSNHSDDGDYSNIIEDTNSLLVAVGISAKTISSQRELQRVASSMFVAIFESLFHKRLDKIVRNPKSKSDYAHNSQCVIDGLSETIKMDLQHITGWSIVNGDIKAISNLVSIFSGIERLNK